MPTCNTHMQQFLPVLCATTAPLQSSSAAQASNMVSLGPAKAARRPRLAGPARARGARSWGPNRSCVPAVLVLAVK